MMIVYDILIVDDEKLVRESIAEAVDWCRFNVKVAGLASNGLEALDMIEKLKPHVVLMDIKMPGLNGIKVIEHVREFSTDIRFIIVSGYADFEYARACMRLGVMHYLLKPFSLSELEEALVSSLDFYETQEQGYDALGQDDQDQRLTISTDINERIEKVKKYVEENINDPDITLGIVSKNIVFMNSDYFGKVFKKATGQYYTQYVMERRMEKAKYLLENSTLKVSEVADSIGFCGNSKYFYEVFRRYTGLTPGEYRKNPKI